MVLSGTTKLNRRDQGVQSRIKAAANQAWPRGSVIGKRFDKMAHSRHKDVIKEYNGV